MDKKLVKELKVFKNACYDFKKDFIHSLKEMLSKNNRFERVYMFWFGACIGTSLEAKKYHYSILFVFAFIFFFRIMKHLSTINKGGD